MRVPGANLLNIALSAIGSATVTYYKDSGRFTTDTGRDVTTFEAAQVIASGSVQPIPMSRYAYLNLDFTKKYVIWFVSRDALGVERGKSGDQIVWNTKRYQIESATDWHAVDGWNELLCVEIDPPC
jgi:hypothetical protein